ncbi:monovalent cation/H+ antiporter subunit D family protein [Porticoccus hydrocarbonoclasticus]|uniref:monovalent cation/H+ antiporter subunit D family protein n=1 Tax=Porticoccus hydrocarbonoclasticus TaxID=1073414 RepID=UPI0005681E17|nr:monovalent cation/H+ antiporter subunit D family protein [Porticoccus hydrocarbonoclasticus]
MTALLALQLTLVVPLCGALLIALCGRWPNFREAITLSTAGLLFYLVIQVFGAVERGGDEATALYVELWQILPGLHIALHSEPLSILFALVASGLWIVTSVYSIGYMRANQEKRQTQFYVCFAVAIFGAMGVAFAANLLTLFLFYEILTLSTYPLVAHKGDDKARAGARTYLGILLATSIGLFLPAMMWTYFVAGTLDFRPGGILEGNIGGIGATILLLMFMFGIGKAALIPVHRWLPAAMVAPTPVSALLHAVAVVKAGVFTIAKVVIYIFGLDFLVDVPHEVIAVYIAGFTIVVASILALRQTNIKRMLAYSTVSQLSYIVLAVLVLTPLSEIGAIVHIVAHAVAKITLFFAAGAIYIASKKTEINQLDGIGFRMPITMGAFAIAAFSMIGVPPTGGFVSKWYMIAGAFQIDSYFVLIVLTLSTGLNAAYFLPIIFRAYFRKESVAPPKPHGEAPLPMVGAICVTALLTLLVFFLNGPLVAFEMAVLGVPR